MRRQKSEQLFGSVNGGSAPRRGRPARPKTGRPAQRKGRRSHGPGLNGRPDRLQRILDAATHVFARDGYHQASMRRIARAQPGPGVGLAGLYHYVDSKERLLFLIQFHAFSALLTEVTAAINGVDDPVEQLRVLIHTHVSYVAQNMAALKVCSHELDSLTGEAFEQVFRVRRRYYELARSIIGRVLEECRSEQGTTLDVRVATMSLFGTLNWLYRWYDPNQDRSPASLANQIFTQFISGVRGGEFAARSRRD